MSQIVQSHCPHCRAVLRIPAEWLDKPMRCKFCRNIFEARPRNGAAALPPTAISAAPVARAARPVARAAATAVTATPPAPAGPIFAPDATESHHAPRTRRPSGGKGKVVALAGCALLLVVAVPATVLIVALMGGFGTAIFDGNWIAIPDDFGEIAATDKPDAHGSAIAHHGNPKGSGNSRDKRNTGKKGGGHEKYGTMPRRALLINVCNYLYLNRVDPGRNRTTSLSALKELGISNAPLNVPPSQIFALSDEGNPPHPTEKSVVKNAIKDFCDTSRAQDRILILFAGHATEIDKDCYLIPIGGRKDDADTLLPLKWVYDQLVACKAQQKVLILDVFRFPPARGFELPGAGASDDGEMGEVFDNAILHPPPGVQVWSSCIKGQRSIEFEGGSVFLQALSRVRDGATMTGIDEGKNPLAINDKFVANINAKMKELIGPAFVQTSRLAGTPPATAVAYDVGEPVALPITLKSPIVQGENLASRAEVNSILQDIKRLPAVRKEALGRRGSAAQGGQPAAVPGQGAGEVQARRRQDAGHAARRIEQGQGRQGDGPHPLREGAPGARRGRRGDRDAGQERASGNA